MNDVQNNDEFFIKNDVQNTNDELFSINNVQNDELVTIQNDFTQCIAFKLNETRYFNKKMSTTQKYFVKFYYFEIFKHLCKSNWKIQNKKSNRLTFVVDVFFVELTSLNKKYDEQINTHQQKNFNYDFNDAIVTLFSFFDSKFSMRFHEIENDCIFDVQINFFNEKQVIDLNFSSTFFDIQTFSNNEFSNFDSRFLFILITKQNIWLRQLHFNMKQKLKKLKST